MKQFFSKAKEFFKKNWKLVSIISAAAVAVIVTVVLCVCLIPRGKKQLEKPENVKVVDETHTLKWDAVENAENGYTVKIGEDETTTVKINSLDLDTVISKLVEGDNKLYVKANETDTYLASEYSAEVIYNYTPAAPPPPVKTAFAAPTATVDGATLKWSAVTGATYYTVKIGDTELEPTTETELDLTAVIDTEAVGVVYKLYVKVNETAEHTESEYSVEAIYSYAPAIIEKSAFDAPEDVTVTGHILSWTAVTGATHYTVKIGETELDPITETELDLSKVVDTSVTATYTVSVKANATDDHKESAYSTEKSYTYTYVKPSFDKPATISVTDDTLTWSAVTGASAYTVKITNSDGTAEQTVTGIQDTSLDLTTVTAKLFRGVNKLYVSAEATADYNASAYTTDEATYNYTPSVDTEVSEYEALVNAIGSITDTSTVAAANEVKAQLTAADTKYNDLSDEALALVTEAKEEYDAKKAAFDTVYNAAVAKHTAIANALSASQTEVEKEEDAAALSLKVTALDAAKPADSTLAAYMITDAEATAYAAVKQALLDWNTAIEAARLVWAEVSEQTFYAIEGTDAQKVEKAEKNIITANGLIAKYSDKKYVQNATVSDESTTKISDKKTIADGALTAAKTAIDTIVAALKENVQPLNGTISAENVTLTYYETLTGYQAVVAAFGEYANTLWDDGLTAKIDNEIAVLLVTPDTTKTVKNQPVAVFNHQNADTTNIFVMRKFINVLDEVLTTESEGFVIPELTVPQGNDAVEATVTAPTAANEDDTFVWTVTFASPAVQTGAAISETVSVTYTVNGEEPQTVDVTIGYTIAGDNNRANTNIFGIHFENGEFKFTPTSSFEADDATVYMDVYQSKYVTYSTTTESVLVKMSSAPLAEKIELSTGLTEDDVVSLLANAGIRTEEQLSLTFVLYQTATIEDKAVCSPITSMSAFTTEFDSITDEDTVPRLWFGGGNAIEVQNAGENAGGFIAGGHFDENRLLKALNSGKTEDDEKVTAQTLRGYLRFHVYVYKDDVEICDFYAPVNGSAQVSNSTLKCAVYNFGNDDGADVSGNITISVAMALAENSGYEGKLRESVKTKPAVWNFTASEDDLYLTIKLGDTPGTMESETEPGGVLVYGRYEVVTEEAGFHDGLSVLAYEIKNGIDVDAYDFVEEGTPFASYIIDSNSAPLDWGKVKDAINKQWRTLSDAERVGTKQFVIVLRKLPNPAGEDIGFKASEVVYIKTSSGTRTVLTYNHDDRLALDSARDGNRFTITATTEEEALAINGGNLDFAWQAGSDDKDLKLGGGMTVFVYAVKDGMDAQTYDFHNPYNYQANIDNAFVTLTYDGTDWLTWSTINKAIDTKWLAQPASEIKEEMKFVFVFQNIVNEAGKEAGYIDSRAVYVTTAADNYPRMVLTYERDFTMPNSNQLNRTNAAILFQGFSVSENIISGYISHMEIHFAKVTDASDTVNPETYYTAYVYYDSENENFVMYDNAEKKGTGLVFGKGANEYYVDPVSVFSNWFNSDDRYEDVTDLDIDGEGWYFRTKLIDNTEDNKYLFGDGTSEWKTFYVPKTPEA